MTEHQCEMQGCDRTATFYVMDQGAGGWGGYACTECAQHFPIREALGMAP